MRMEDPLAELRYGIEQVGAICLSHLYQFGPPNIMFQTNEQGKTVNKTVQKRILRSGIKLKMQGINVVFNPDAEFQKWMLRHRALIVDPIIAKNEEGRHELLRRALRNGRVEGKEKILPPLEVVAQRRQQEMQQAMQQVVAAREQAAAQGQVQDGEVRVEKEKQKTQIQKSRLDQEVIATRLIEEALKKFDAETADRANTQA